MIGIGPLEIVKLAIYYGSYLYFIVAPIIIWAALTRRGLARQISYLAIVLLILFAYARFIEPRRLLVAEHDIQVGDCFDNSGAAKIAVVADMHIGLFGNAIDARRITEKLNKANPDFILFAGDFIYFLHPEEFISEFGSFAQLSAPAFAVLGNHDVGLPGPDLRKELNDKLNVVGLRLIDDKAQKVSNRRMKLDLVGLSDRWANSQNLDLLKRRLGYPRIVLTHNPATVHDFENNMSADLLIGGHTHGGQINLPVITCVFTGFCGDVAYGHREEKGVQIFTTSGTGMVGLPLRFRMPPRIDILNIEYERCSASNRKN